MHGEPTAVSSADLARLLGTTSRQVHAWHTRRDRNGFPEPVGCVLRPTGGGRRGGPLHDVAAVRRWLERYDPKASGARAVDRSGRDRRIRRLADAGKPHAAIAAEVGLDRSMVSRILRANPVYEGR